MTVSSHAEMAERFSALHRTGEPVLPPNPWDAGSARVPAWLGCEALATTSSGSAATLGLLDGQIGASPGAKAAVEAFSAIAPAQ